MDIKTKFNIFDDCYFMKKNKVCVDEINDLEISVYRSSDISAKTHIIVKYSTVKEDRNFTESELFKTKQDLLDSL